MREETPVKKFFAAVLILCLAAACAPAMATDNYVHAGEGILDLSNGPLVLTYNLNETRSASFFQRHEVRCLDTIWYARDTHRIQLIGRDEGINGSYTERYSLDGDDTVDIIVKGDFRNSPNNKITFEAAATASCGPVYMLECGTDTVPLPYPSGMPDYAYYSPLSIIFPGGTAYSDSTGSYELTEDGATFVKPAKPDTGVKVPDTVTVGKTVFPVTKIGDWAFKNQKKLTKVTIGKNIKEIGKGAFYKCLKLKTVSGGANLEIIGDQAFSGCKALKKFTIGAKVIKIGKKAFYKCAALKKVTIKSTLLTAKTVGSAAFKGINAKATIKVPKAVKKEYTKWLLKKGVKKTMKIK